MYDSEIPKITKVTVSQLLKRWKSIICLYLERKNMCPKFGVCGSGNLEIWVFWNSRTLEFDVFGFFTLGNPTHRNRF